MNVKLIAPLTKEKILDHTDDLISQIKKYNLTASNEIMQVVLEGHVVNSKLFDNTLYIKQKFPSEMPEFLKSNYVAIKDIALIDVKEQGTSKIVFETGGRNRLKLTQSLGITKDYFLDTKMNHHLSQIKKRFT